MAVTASRTSRGFRAFVLNSVGSELRANRSRRASSPSRRELAAETCASRGERVEATTIFFARKPSRRRAADGSEESKSSRGDFPAVLATRACASTRRSSSFEDLVAIRTCPNASSCHTSSIASELAPPRLSASRDASRAASPGTAPASRIFANCASNSFTSPACAAPSNTRSNSFDALLLVRLHSGPFVSMSSASHSAPRSGSPARACARMICPCWYELGSYRSASDASKASSAASGSPASAAMCMSASYAGAPWSSGYSSESSSKTRSASAGSRAASEARMRAWNAARGVLPDSSSCGSSRDRATSDRSTSVSSAAASSGPAATRVSAGKSPSSRSRLGGEAASAANPRAVPWGTSRPRRPRSRVGSNRGSDRGDRRGCPCVTASRSRSRASADEETRAKSPPGRLRACLVDDGPVVSPTAATSRSRTFVTRPSAGRVTTPIGTIHRATLRARLLSIPDRSPDLRSALAARTSLW